MTLALRYVTVPDSPLARWDARWKLAALLACVAGTTSLRTPAAAGVALLAALALVRLGCVPRAAVLERLAVVGFAVVPALVVVPLRLAADGPGWAVGPVFVSVPGVIAAAGIALRALAIGLFVLVLLRTAPVADTLAAAHRLRAPGVLVQVAQLAHRYAFLLAAEARRVRVALRTRGFRPRTNAHTYRTLGQSVGGVLVRGGERAERVAAAMRCRGFDGTFRTATELRTTPADVAGFAAVVGGVAGLLIADRLW